MATIDSLQKRYDDIVSQYDDHADSVEQVQKIALEELIPDVRDELDLDEAAVASATKFVRDRGSLLVSSRQRCCCSRVCACLGG